MTTQISGTTGVSQVQPASVVDASLNLTANSAPVKTALNASGNAPIFACRAWVNFNGQGTVAIRASGNVVGITDNAVGDYTINFTTPMQDINYALSGMSDVDGSGQAIMLRAAGVPPLVGSVRVLTYHPTVAAQDHLYNSVSIFR